MYARGMLDENPSLASQQKEASGGPTVYASFNDRRSENLHKAYGLNRSRRIASPAASTEGAVISAALTVKAKAAIELRIAA